MSSYSYSDYPRHSLHDIVSESSPYTPIPQSYHKSTRHQPQCVHAYESPYSDHYESRHKYSRAFESYDPPPTHHPRHYPPSDPYHYPYYVDSYESRLGYSPSYASCDSSLLSYANTYSSSRYYDNSSRDSYEFLQKECTISTSHPPLFSFVESPKPIIRERLKVEVERKKSREDLASILADLSVIHKTCEDLQRPMAILIQAHFRGYLERRSLERKRQAILFIQTQIRGSLQRSLFLRIQGSIVIIQRHVRQWILRRRSVICHPQWIYYNPLFSTDGEDWEEESVVEEPLSTIQVRVATPMDLLQRFGRPLLTSPDRDLLYLLDDAAKGRTTCYVESSDSAQPDDSLHMGLSVWDPGDPVVPSDFFSLSWDMVICLDLESAAPSLVFSDQVLLQRPPPKPPKGRDCYYSLLRSTFEADTGLMICDNTVRRRPPLKPPWRF